MTDRLTGLVLERLSPLIMELILVDQLEDTNNERLSLAMPHSGLKPKNENDPKEEDDLNGRRPLTEDNF